MLYLLLTSLLWGISFGLVKGQLQGIDPTAIATVRMLIALAIFLPLLKSGNIGWPARMRLGAIGAVQFGLMYIFYLKSFAYLQAYEVALFTIFTPLYIVLIDALMERHWSNRFLVAAVLAAGGAAIVLDFTSMTHAHWMGFLLLQLSNLCFAVGQLAWRREHKRLESAATDAQLFAIPYAGGFVATLIASAFITDWGSVVFTNNQILCVVYLGVVASGVCFFLWNVGAEKVNAGTLAVMNNAKIPVAVLISLVVFREKADLARLLIGGAVIGGGIWISNSGPKPGQSTAKS